MLKLLPKKPVSELKAATLPLLYIVLVLFTDHIISSTTITPTLCGIGLLSMSFFLPTRWMAIWALIYTSVVFGIFNFQSIYEFVCQAPVVPPDFIGHNIRTIGLFVVGLFCIGNTLILNGFRKIIAQQYEILSKIPNPLVVSDVGGKILFCNRGLLEKYGFSENELKEKSFFDLFSPDGNKGITISRYLARIEGNQNNQVLKLEICSEIFVGETVLLNNFPTICMLTIFKPFEEEAPILAPFL